MNLLEKFKSGLTKTRENVFGQIGGLLRNKKIDESTLNEIEELLVMGDVGIHTTRHILDEFQERIKKEKKSEESDYLDILREVIEKLLLYSPELQSDYKPRVILVIGVNGTGKTTSIGKLAYKFKKTGRSVIVGAADTFRAAAIEQLEIWAGRAGVDLIKNQAGSDPASVAFDTVNAAISRGYDIVIIDTAGRLHTKVNLMEELAKIKRVIQKKLPDAPHEIFLVLDGTTGQNALSQARQFIDKIGVTGIILTKLDGTAKGGVVISICQELNLPVKYVGLGEGIDDLEPFNPKNFTRGLFS